MHHLLFFQKIISRTLPGSLLLLLFLACQSSSEKQAQRPNIVFILVDDLGKEWVSAYGAEDISTPNIDALAASGLLFHNAYAMPQCTPSRVTLLTGQYPFRHGWVNYWDVPRWGGGAHFDETLNPSLGKALKQAGYVSCIAGKWQIDDFRVEPDALSRNDFDAYCMWTGYESGIPASGERYHDPYVFTQSGSRTHEGAYGPDLFTDFIKNFIQEHKEKRFFVYYPMVLTHPPLVNPPGDTATTMTGKHQAMVRYADRLTGRIVQALEEAGVRDNTLILWTTDNGTSRSLVGTYRGRKVPGGKAETREEGICVPFIASWPAQLAGGQRTEALVDFTDIFPTFLDLAGIEVGQEWSVNGVEQPIDGISFKEVLEDPQASPRSWIMSMGGGNHARLTDQGVENQFRFRDRVLRNARYKLCIGPDRAPEAFYDLKEDPAETRNLLDSLTTAERQENFNTLLEVAEIFPSRDSDPRYLPNPAAQEWDIAITAESEVWKR